MNMMNIIKVAVLKLSLLLLSVLSKIVLVMMTIAIKMIKFNSLARNTNGNKQHRSIIIRFHSKINFVFKVALILLVNTCMPFEHVI